MAGSEGEGGLMKGHVPQGDTHSATQLSLFLQKLWLPALAGDTWALLGFIEAVEAAAAAAPCRPDPSYPRCSLMSLTTAKDEKS